jgi:hypothetical protein
VDRIQPPQDRAQWWDVVNRVMKFRVSYKGGIFYVAVSFSRLPSIHLRDQVRAASPLTKKLRASDHFGNTVPSIPARSVGCRDSLCITCVKHLGVGNLTEGKSLCVQLCLLYRDLSSNRTFNTESSDFLVTIKGIYHHLLMTQA